MWKDKIIGQQVILNQLFKALEHDQLSHALIISGLSGRGGLPLALSIAQQLLCSNSSGGMACGECRSCHQVDQLMHPDLHMAYPVVGKEGQVRKNITSTTYIAQWREAVIQNAYLSLQDWIQTISTKKAQADINATECNQIIQKLSMQAFVGDKKVQLIWMSQMLGKNGNKLLKLIEEPPEGTHFVLMCDHRDQLLKTVVSRCQVIEIPRIADEAIQQVLEKNYNLGEDQARQAAFIAEGDFRAALEVSYQGSEDLLSLSLEWMRACADHDYNEMRNWSEQFTRLSIEDQKAIAHFTLRMLREILHLNVLGQDFCRLIASDIDKIKRLPKLSRLKSTDIERIHSAVSSMLDGIYRNINARLMMFEACLDIDLIFSRQAKRELTT